MNYINYLNSAICEGRQTDIQILENMSVDEYFMTVQNFLKIAEQKSGQTKK